MLQVRLASQSVRAPRGLQSAFMAAELGAQLIPMLSNVLCATLHRGTDHAETQTLPCRGQAAAGPV